MSVLTVCTEEWGGSSIINSEPSISVYQDSFYLPFAPDEVWGLFNTSGGIIEDSVDFRDEIKDTNSQLLVTSLNYDQVEMKSPQFDYVYGGRIHLHYGHFIINTLPRFWNIDKIFKPGMKILCHGPGQPEDWFSFPFFAEAMSTLRLGVEDFIVFDGPTRVASIILPRTSLQEQVSGHRIFSDLCFLMGRAICREEITSDSLRPVYFSKTRLSGGVGTIVNERVVEEKLEAAGVEICYPETLSFYEQVRMYSQRTTFLGSAGSFFHTSMFSPAPRRIIALNPAAQINSNFLIVDKLVGNEAIYLYDQNIEVLPESGESKFLTQRHLPDPDAVAQELLSYI